jgi:hypothetical protein
VYSTLLGSGKYKNLVLFCSILHPLSALHLACVAL